LIQTQHI